MNHYLYGGHKPETPAQYPDTATSILPKMQDHQAEMLIGYHKMLDKSVRPQKCVVPTTNKQTANTGNIRDKASDKQQQIFTDV